MKKDTTRSALPPAALLAAGMLLGLATLGCGLFNRDPKPKPADESLGRADVMRADQEMRDSADALVREYGDKQAPAAADLARRR